jgi:hypothetical protein
LFFLLDGLNPATPLVFSHPLFRGRHSAAIVAERGYGNRQLDSLAFTVEQMARIDEAYLAAFPERG